VDLGAGGAARDGRHPNRCRRFPGDRRAPLLRQPGFAGGRGGAAAQSRVATAPLGFRRCSCRSMSRACGCSDPPRRGSWARSC
jgi:hypothetical protein